MNNNIRRSISVIVATASLLAMCVSIAAQPAADMRRVLAPSGKLRVGVYPGSPTSMIQDASTGQRKGVPYDLGTELAKRLGVPFEPVVFQRVAEVVDALKSGQVDFTITNASPARVKDLDFTPRPSRVCSFVQCRRTSSGVGCARRCAGTCRRRRRLLMFATPFERAECFTNGGDIGIHNPWDSVTWIAVKVP